MAKTLKLSKKRKQYKTFYHNKYYDVWMNRFEYEELDREQNEWLFRKLWTTPSVAGFIIDGTKGSSEAPNGIPCLCMYAPAMYNIYDYPTKCTLVNTRGVKFIPTTLQEINKDVVIFYSNKLRKSIYEMIEHYIDRLALVECVIELNLNAHKTPFIIPIAPEDEDTLNNLYDDIENDESKIYISAENFDKFKILLTGNQYIIDKLYNLKDKLECELKEFFGFNNLPIGEKKEHLISNEIDSNNEFIAFRYESLKDVLKTNGKMFEEVFGYKLTLKEKDIEHEGDSQEKEKENEI